MRFTVKTDNVGQSLSQMKKTTDSLSFLSVDKTNCVTIDSYISNIDESNQALKDNLKNVYNYLDTVNNCIIDNENHYLGIGLEIININEEKLFNSGRVILGKKSTIDRFNKVIKMKSISFNEYLKNPDISAFVVGDFLSDGKVTEEEKAAMKHNTQLLQNAVDNAKGHTTIYLPPGVIYFRKGDYGSGSIDINNIMVECVIHLSNNNVTISGAGTDENNMNSCTILRPYSDKNEIMQGLDMFYFNDLDENGNNRYLENVDFKDFVIDSANTTAVEYTSSGKGFMINYLKDCDWYNVVVKNTDGTGIGIDCPINCSIKKCTTENCGKIGWQDYRCKGGSGFGIGTGASEEESLLIEDCVSIGNMKYGFFFENQGYFLGYKVVESKGFVVKNCVSIGNMYNYGTESGECVSYIDCESKSAVVSDLNFAYNSSNCFVQNLKTDKVFSDVNTNSEYYNSINWAMSNGLIDGSVIEGYKEGHFGIGENMTTSEFLSILWKKGNMQPVVDNDAIINAKAKGYYKGRDGLYKLSYEVNPANENAAPTTKESTAMASYNWAMDNGLISDDLRKERNEIKNESKKELLEMLYQGGYIDSLDENNLNYVRAEAISIYDNNPETNESVRTNKYCYITLVLKPSEEEHYYIGVPLSEEYNNVSINVYAPDLYYLENDNNITKGEMIEILAKIDNISTQEVISKYGIVGDLDGYCTKEEFINYLYNAN